MNSIIVTLSICSVKCIFLMNLPFRLMYLCFLFIMTCNKLYSLTILILILVVLQLFSLTLSLIFQTYLPSLIMFVPISSYVLSLFFKFDCALNWYVNFFHYKKYVHGSYSPFLPLFLINE